MLSHSLRALMSSSPKRAAIELQHPVAPWRRPLAAASRCAFPCGMPPGLGNRLRHLLCQFREDFDPVAEQHEAVGAALCNLEVAVDECFLAHAPRRRRRRGREGLLASKKMARLQAKLKWARAARRRVEKQLERAKLTKDSKKFNRMTPAFLARVALSWPSTCASTFASAWRDLVGVGKSGCSRPTIAKVRDAMAEVVKAMTAAAARKAAKQAVAAAVRAPDPPAEATPGASAAPAPGFLAVCFLHIHDEASLRLRSAGKDDLGAPSRSRQSSVQQHACSLFLPGQETLPWPTELNALGDKGARVLATALDQVMRPVATLVGECFVQKLGMDRPWFLHILVGDGCKTNEAAAKVVLALARGEPLPHGLRYFLIVVRCASHQANLAIASAVAGRAASAAAFNAAGLGADPLRRRLAPFDCPSRAVCAAIVRFYKFLVNAYYGDMCANLQEVVGRMRAREFHENDAAAARAHWDGMAELYGAGVIPPGLLDSMSGGLGAWAHFVPPGAEEELDEAKCKALEILRRRLLVCDEHPTLTRMFTFAPHVEGFLLLHFLGCVEDLVKWRGTQARDKSRKRVQRVLAFFAKPGTGEFLKRTALALQICGHVHGVCAQDPIAPEPLLVRLSKGVVGDIVSGDFARTLGRLHKDPDLDCGACVTELVAVCTELALRFKQYLGWPFAAWALCEAFNPQGYIAAALRFLQLPDEALDKGFGAPLRQMADRAGRSDADRIRFLTSQSVQSAIVEAFRAAAASSLPVERRFAEVKRAEAPRLCHVATAGRNLILRHLFAPPRGVLAGSRASRCRFEVVAENQRRHFGLGDAPSFGGELSWRRRFGSNAPVHRREPEYVAGRSGSPSTESSSRGCQGQRRGVPCH